MRFALHLVLTTLRRSRRRAVASVAVLLLVACGNRAPPRATPPLARSASSGSSSPASSAPPFAVTPPPSGLPPFAMMPPPGVAGSKRAKKKVDPSFAACHAAFRASSKDLGAEVAKLGQSCAASTKMHAVGGLLRGAQGEGDPHQEYKLRVEANHCYRVFVAYDVKDIGLIVRDSSGDVAGEDSGRALFDDGAICFTSSDDATVVVTVGGGRGAYAAQVWSD